jgi:hypothetical protein
LPPIGELAALRIGGATGKSASGFAFAATGTGAFGFRAIAVLAGLPTGFAFGVDATFGIVAVVVSDIVGISAARMIGAGASGIGAVASGDAEKLCMQIKHSIGVPAATSMPKVSVDPQCGQMSCVDVTMVRRASLG